MYCVFYTSQHFSLGRIWSHSPKLTWLTWLTCHRGNLRGPPSHAIFPPPKKKGLVDREYERFMVVNRPSPIRPFLWFLGGSSWTRKWLILITIDEFSSPKDRVVGPLPNGWSINGGDPITTEAKVLGWDPPRGGLLGTLQLGSSILLMATRNPDSDHHLGMVLKGLSKYWDQHLPKGAVWTLRDGGFLAPQTSSLPGTPKGRSRDKTSNFNWLHSRMLSIHFFSSPRKCPNWSQISGQRLWQLYMCYLRLNEGGDCDLWFENSRPKKKQTRHRKTSRCCFFFRVDWQEGFFFV